MPGLSQLKKFNADILSLGNEAELRAKRGEKVVQLSVPKEIQDVDDSDDFVMGMPEVSEDIIAAQEEKPVQDDDFSDITGTASASNENSSSVEAAVPDVSSLLNPINFADNSDEGDSVPDLSLFMEPPETDVPEEVPEEKEPEISDLSLEDLLGGTGFDGSEGASEETEAENAESEEAENDSAEMKAGFSGGDDFSAPELSYTEEESASSIPPLDDILAENEPKIEESQPESVVPDTSDEESLPSPQENFSDDTEELEPLETLYGDTDMLPDGDDIMPGASFSAEDLAELSGLPDGAVVDSDVSSDSVASSEDSTSAPESPADDFGIDGLEIEDITGTELEKAPDFDFSSSSETETENPVADGGKPADDFGIDGLEIEDITGMEPEKSPDFPSLSSSESAVSDSVQQDASSDDFDFSSIPDTDFDLSSLTSEKDDSDSAGQTDSAATVSETAASESTDSDGFSLPDLGMDFGSEGSDNGTDADFSKEAEQNDEFKLSDFGDSSFDSEVLDTPDFSSAVQNDGDTFSNESSASETSSDSSVTDDFPSDFNFNLDDIADEGDAGGTSADDSVPLESFDTSAMEGLEFPDTDAQLAGTDNSGFELGSDDDIKLENGDFEIPGFSDVDTVAEHKNGKIGPVPVKSKDEEDNSGLPPNTLSDEQYQKFLRNLLHYPLNVRIAVEELIVKDEFTDEAEFEIVQKVLKKVPARSLASELEKMLDIALPVPRDFERRTSEEYELYKSSLQYQLRNKILPGAILCAAASALCVLLFLFAKNFIYKPAMASHLYKQGYVLLQDSDYPNSEVKFNEAVLYDLQKKWFFRYARGYREHKQYVRAEKMYRNILYCFRHDKKAGLEYAQMELDELADYESAENVLLREVLDYHVNDPDGLLLLGDTYLEWATEKNSAKFEDARIKYAELIQLYGSTNVYLSRMMRYFMRTDNLQEVLPLKEYFMPKENSLGAQDWTELSGFLLDKLYGPLAPADEYLRTRIEDVKECLMRAVRADSANPVALYNLSRYYVQMRNSINAKSALERTLSAFGDASVLKKRDMYKYIDSYRLLGEEYTDEREYLRARENFTSGISLFTNAHEMSGLDGNSAVGKLYADMGDLDYFISGDVDSALLNYQDSVNNGNDTPEIRYKIGAVQYGKNNYSEALGSFMKAAEDASDDTSVLLAMGNTLSQRNDVYAAKGYYEKLLDILDRQKEQKGILFPQTRSDESEIVDLYLKSSNNLGVTLYKLARRTGNSTYNAQAAAQFQQSVRAWDALTRNQQTLVRLGGSNLAEQNIKYITHPLPDFEPAIYTDIPRTLSVEKGLTQ